MTRAEYLRRKAAKARVKQEPPQKPIPSTEPLRHVASLEEIAFTNPDSAMLAVGLTVAAMGRRYGRRR